MGLWLLEAPPRSIEDTSAQGRCVEQAAASVPGLSHQNLSVEGRLASTWRDSGGSSY